MFADFKLSCVLFDLDGTLIDTAPDLFACLNKSLVQHGYDPATIDEIKPSISHGAVVLVDKLLQQSANTETKALIVETMMDIYLNNIAEHSVFFEGMAETLEVIEAQGLKWGVVTNKRERYTNPLMSALNLTERAACIISGDTTGNPKPHVEPMLAACKIAHVNPEECFYIGDASHDIEAGKNAKMKTLVALYGYIKEDDRPETWGADALIASPLELTALINSLL